MTSAKNAIRYAIAVAIAGSAANSASAFDISTYNSSTAVNVYLSGSTAVDGTIQNVATEVAGPGGLCTAGSLDVYYIGTPSTYTERLFLCTGSSTAGSAAGKQLAIYKESNVGSVNGVQPLLQASQGLPTGVFFIDPTKISDTNCSVAATVASTGDFATYVNHSGCPSTSVTAATAVPTGGFADVEAAILRTPSNGTVNAALVGSQLTAAPTLDVVWGVALTKNAYYALQSAEGITATGSARDLPANAPSLSKEQVASIFAGQISDLGIQLGLTNSASADTNVYLCRRDNGSGTEASFEAYFLNARCAGSGSESMQSENGSTVWASGSNGGVRNCLEVFYGNQAAGGNTGTVTIKSFYNQDGSFTATGPTNPFQATEPGNQFALGIVSTEVSAGNLSGANDSFRLVAVDGVMPTLENTINGFYPYFSTGVAYYISSGQNQPSASALSVFKAIQGKLGHPVWTSDSDSSYAGRPWGNGGDLAPALLYAANGGNNLTSPATAASALATPINAFTKAPSGAVSNCNTPVLDTNDLANPVTPVESSLLGTGTVNN